MLKKRFLLLAPDAFGLYRLIVKNLEYLGYEVVHIEDKGYPFKYNSLWQRLYNLVRKVFLNDKSYKNKLRQIYPIKKQSEILNQHDSYDFALVIRADFFEQQLIESIRSKSVQMISFHFDGISRDLRILEYIHFFDRFYVFDEEDIINFSDYPLLYSPNFYLDYPNLLGSFMRSENYDVYYVSTFHESRLEHLISVHQFLARYYDRLKFIVVCNMENLPIVPNYILQEMDLRHEQISFEEQLNYIASSAVIIDLVIADHSGYSFRIIEGIKFEKKVITTNPKIREAEFYHPNNFFLLTKENYCDLKDFLETSYKPLDPVIKNKYSFSNWLSDKLIEQ